MTKYLDIYELGELMGMSPVIIRKDTRRNPRRAPSKMYIPGTKMLRWGCFEVERWPDENLSDQYQHQE